MIRDRAAFEAPRRARGASGSGAGLIEVKAAGLAEPPSVRRKRKAAGLRRRRRGMDYAIETIAAPG